MPTFDVPKEMETQTERLAAQSIGIDGHIDAIEQVIVLGDELG